MLFCIGKNISKSNCTYAKILQTVAFFFISIAFFLLLYFLLLLLLLIVASKCYLAVEAKLQMISSV